MMVLTPSMLNMHYMIDDNTNEMRVLPISKIHAFQRTRYCQFLIAESRDKGKFLAIDGRIQTSESEYEEYHTQLLANIPESNGRALLLGAGEGVTGAMLSAKGYTVDAVDIDGILIKNCEEHLADWIRPYKVKNKITTYIYDAMDFLDHIASSNDDFQLRDVVGVKYDVVVFDLTEPNVASENCYSTDLIDKIKKVINPGAIFAYQNGSVYDKDPIMDRVLEKYEKEVLQETISELAEWKFGAIRFKGDNLENN